MVALVSDTGSWDRFAATLRKLATIEPGIATAQDMVKISNAVYPFASALTMLDLGCGLGQVTSQLLAAHGTELPTSSRLVASDFAPAMIEQVEIRKAEEFAKGDALWNRVETLICDVQDLSAFPDGSVSHAFAGFLMLMVPKAHEAMKDIRRVLTDHNGGGVFTLSTWQDSEWFDLIALVAKVRPAKAVPLIPLTWSTVEGVRGELEAAGFRDVEVHTMVSYWPFDDYEELVQLITTQLPAVRSMTSDMSSDELRQVQDLMVEHMKAKHPTAPSRLAGTAIIGFGRK
jgi:ubiquinone/menaquinone biosynthesis C-methylase UbiE